MGERDGVEEAPLRTQFPQSITQMASEADILSSGIRRKTNPPAARPSALEGLPTLLAGWCWGQGVGGGGGEVGQEPGLRHRGPVDSLAAAFSSLCDRVRVSIPV